MPDTWNRPVLAEFEQRAAARRKPEALEKSAIVDDGGRATHRYMKALPWPTSASTAHGPADSLPDPGVRAVLQATHPRDQAVGYARGQIRGRPHRQAPAVTSRAPFGGTGRGQGMPTPGGAAARCSNPPGAKPGAAKAPVRRPGRRPPGHRRTLRRSPGISPAGADRRFLPGEGGRGLEMRGLRFLGFLPTAQAPSTVCMARVDAGAPPASGQTGRSMA